MFWVCVICAATLLPQAAFAKNKSDLQHIQKEIDSSRARQDALNNERKKIEDELKEIQEKLVASARAMQKVEAELSAAEEKLRILGEQLVIKNAELTKRKKNLAGLVSAALHISRTPADAIVLMPGDSRDAMKASRALKMTSQAIKEELASIQLQLEELQKLKDKIAAQKDLAKKKQTVLAAAQTQMKTEQQKRKKFYEKLNAEQKEEAEKVARLAKQAETTKALIADIERQTRSYPDNKQIRGKKGSLRSFSAAKGRIRLPVMGEIVETFASSKGKNETSKGVSFDARTSAQVVAPFDGEVVFTGPFMSYGRMIILRHSDGFHTLLAGLAKIDVSPGEFLLEGEPIGAMGSKDSNDRLYLELRKDNQPVDPESWLTNH